MRPTRRSKKSELERLQREIVRNNAYVEKKRKNIAQLEAENERLLQRLEEDNATFEKLTTELNYQRMLNAFYKQLTLDASNSNSQFDELAHAEEQDSRDTLTRMQ